MILRIKYIVYEFYTVLQIQNSLYKNIKRY